MAAAAAMMNRHIVSAILHHLSDMKYKERRQYGPDQPVEFLEFRPTLVPSILVNKLWADEGTSILWKRYPHLPALKSMSPERQQYYANKVEWVFSMSPPPGHSEGFEYLEGLVWPSLKSLELEIDFLRHGAYFTSMLHPGLKHLELSGFQSGDSKYFSETVLPALFNRCKNLKSIRIGPETIPDDDPLHSSALFDVLDAIPSISTIEVKGTNFVDKMDLFARLSQRPGFEGLEVDLEPGLTLIPLLSGPLALDSPFSSLKSLWVMCYPEIALALPVHLHLLEDLQLDISRMEPAQLSDHTIFEDLAAELSNCPNLKKLKVGVSLQAAAFDSVSSYPTLTGSALVKLVEACPKLDDINLLTAEPSAIDGSTISSEDFDAFCKALPNLRSLNLKLHPPTISQLESSALQSLGQHCVELEILRLKLPFQLPSLPVSNTVPRILINGEASPDHPSFEEHHSTGADITKSPDTENSSLNSSFADLAITSGASSPAPIPPSFPRLTHLAIARPETALAAAEDSFTVSSASHSTSEIVDAELEEHVVRSWAHAILAHFPQLEILEAWGDWTGQDNESLNYFLPTQEILASTWEFLSGVEQDLWEDDEELEEGDNWHTFEGSEDWEKASLMNEFPGPEHEIVQPSVYDDEPEGMVTPGRTVDPDELF